jgi:hypothetical protein
MYASTRFMQKYFFITKLIVLCTDGQPCPLCFCKRVEQGCPFVRQTNEYGK